MPTSAAPTLPPPANTNAVVTPVLFLGLAGDCDAKSPERAVTHRVIRAEQNQFRRARRLWRRGE